MRDRIAATALAIVLVPASAGACAMNAPGHGRGACEVADAGKLSAEWGGADAVCAAVRRAAADQGLAGDFSVRVQIQSAYLATAAVTLADGRTLPEVKTASSDRPLSASSFRLLGQAIAAQVSAAAR